MECISIGSRMNETHASTVEQVLAVADTLTKLLTHLCHNFGCECHLLEDVGILLGIDLVRAGLSLGTLSG
jgi:hypothetical protein